jgi:hypothetical protein
MLSNLRVSITVVLSGPSQRNAVQDRAPVTNGGGLSDHNARSVVEKQPRPNLRQRVQIHPEQRRGLGLQVEGGELLTPRGGRLGDRPRRQIL